MNKIRMSHCNIQDQHQTEYQTKNLHSDDFTQTDPVRVIRRRLFIRDHVVQASIGVHAHEKIRRQTVIVNVDADVVYDEACLDDSIDTILDYDHIVRLIEDIVASGHIGLVETLADRIARQCLESPLMSCVRVEITKPEAIDSAAGVGIVVTYGKDPLIPAIQAPTLAY